MSRKTVRMQDVLDLANARLALIGPIGSVERNGQFDRKFREGVIALLEPLLHLSDTYAGFRYQSSELLEDGTLRPDHDDTRRIYYPPRF